MRKLDPLESHFQILAGGQESKRQVEIGCLGLDRLARVCVKGAHSEMMGDHGRRASRGRQSAGFFQRHIAQHAARAAVDRQQQIWREPPHLLGLPGEGNRVAGMKYDDRSARRGDDEGVAEKAVAAVRVRRQRLVRGAKGDDLHARKRLHGLAGVDQNEPILRRPGAPQSLVPPESSKPDPQIASATAAAGTRQIRGICATRTFRS